MTSFTKHKKTVRKHVINVRLDLLSASITIHYSFCSVLTGLFFLHILVLLGLCLHMGLISTLEVTEETTVTFPSGMM